MAVEGHALANTEQIALVDPPSIAKGVAVGCAYAASSTIWFTPLGIYYVYIPVGKSRNAPIRFTFHYPEEGRWEGMDHCVAICHQEHGLPIVEHTEERR